MKINYYTKGGLNKLRLELNQLKDVERPKASKAIAEARDKGDLSENAEYDAAKEAQGLLELKISKLEEEFLQHVNSKCKKVLNELADGVLKDESLKILEDAAKNICLLYTSPSPRDATLSRMPSSA